MYYIYTLGRNVMKWLGLGIWVDRFGLWRLYIKVKDNIKACPHYR